MQKRHSFPRHVDSKHIHIYLSGNMCFLFFFPHNFGAERGQCPHESQGPKSVKDDASVQAALDSRRLFVAGWGLSYHSHQHASFIPDILDVPVSFPGIVFGHV